ncbi:MAG: septum formation initiator family protein [Alphaproteobacteria bacterium]|nr:septum formation initiator family protein [Alphaproteobacteria bacterium]
MLILNELRRQGRQIIASIFGVAVIGYFAFHAVEGERGLRSYFALNLQTELAREERDALRHDRLAIERRVKLLASESLDLDMLDERARVLLNNVHEDDFVILLTR